MPEHTTTAVLAAIVGLLAGVAARYARRNRALERQIAALDADKANCEASKAAALTALNEAILQNNHLRHAMPIMVIAGQPFVQTYEMQRGFSLN
jgi:hypothetical protein